MFRFVAMQQRPSAVAEMETNVIHKNEYMSSNPQAAGNTTTTAVTSAIWKPQELRTVPAFYPLEKSSRLVEDDTAAAVAARLSDCLRQLSIHAVYSNDTACLMTAENVEMHLSLWKSPPTSPQQGIVVELQRRSGDSIAFHKYSRTILDAALGLLDANVLLEMEDDVVYSKKVQRLLLSELRKNSADKEEHETAVQAIEIAHGLLMKDRMDARVLGLESLCLLTDPRKTGFITSLLTSHVVLLGSTQGVEIPGLDSALADQDAEEGPFQEIRAGILNLVQFKRIGSEDDDDFTNDDDGTMMDTVDKEHMTLLHNLALAVLANALDCVEHPERRDLGDHSSSTLGDEKPRPRMRTASSTEVANEFLQQTEELSKKEILSTLISELGKAADKPHNAVLSAKCIGSLCRASDEAKKRAQELGAKQVVSTALEVGIRTHLRLETECERVVTVLERTTSEEDGTREEEDEHM
jgi:hypothetical protein